MKIRALSLAALLCLPALAQQPAPAKPSASSSAKTPAQAAVLARVEANATLNKANPPPSGISDKEKQAFIEARQEEKRR